VLDENEVGFSLTDGTIIDDDETLEAMDGVEIIFTANKPKMCSVDTTNKVCGSIRNVVCTLCMKKQCEFP
jgi:hypothetical protein